MCHLGTTPKGGADASATWSLSSTCLTPLERRAMSIARCRSSSDCTWPSRVRFDELTVSVGGANRGVLARAGSSGSNASAKLRARQSARSRRPAIAPQARDPAVRSARQGLASAAPSASTVRPLVLRAQRAPSRSTCAFRGLIDASGVHREYGSVRLRTATAEKSMISAESPGAEIGSLRRVLKRSETLDKHQEFLRGGRDLNPRPPA